MKYMEKYLVHTYWGDKSKVIIPSSSTGGEKTELCITIDGENSKIYYSKDNTNKMGI